MNKIFELYDNILNERISCHKTLNGALKAMSEAVTKITPGLCRDYEEDLMVNFELKYQIKTITLKD